MATPKAQFPYCIVDENGICHPFRPPHPKMSHCADHCNNVPPGKHSTWSEYNKVFTTHLRGRYLAHKIRGTMMEGMLYGIQPLDRRS